MEVNEADPEAVDDVSLMYLSCKLGSPDVGVAVALLTETPAAPALKSPLTIKFIELIGDR